MLFVRPVFAQYYRRGKSLGRRNFSSPRSFYNSISLSFFVFYGYKQRKRSWMVGHSVSDVDVVMKSGINVIKGIFNTSVGLGLGTGLGYLIMGHSNSSEYVQQVEEVKQKHFPISLFTSFQSFWPSSCCCVSRSGREISGR